MSLIDYRTLGRSGLVVSPLALGTMTFGTARWGTDEATSRDVFTAYVGLGGNFIDTADGYAGGRSEELVGQFIEESAMRDRLVLATKFGFSAGSGWSGGGNGAKHVQAALDGSLGRLRTDYIDLYWMHVWDGLTPAEELLETMGNLVRSGKILYWGMSNAPAWYIAQVATLARMQGKPGPIAQQFFYSLVNRDVEDEHIPLAKEFGMGMVPWSPLAYGLLTGKYDRAATVSRPPNDAGLPNEAASQSDNSREAERLNGANPFGDTLFTDRNWVIIDALREVAAEAGHSMARVALAWVAGQPGVASTLIGVSRASQVSDNAQALSFELAPELRNRLDTASGDSSRFVYGMAREAMRKQVIFGGDTVRTI